MRVSSASHGVVVAATAMVFGGCFTYIPAELETVPAGEDVRVYLTREVMAELREADEQGLPESGPPLVRGTLVRRDNAGLALRIPIATREVGFLRTPIARQVNIPSSEVVQIERRQLHRGRTVLGVAGTGGLVGVVVYFVLNDARPPEQGPDTPSDDATRIPLFSFAIR